MAHGREIWRGTLQLKKGEKWKIRLLIAYCGTKEHSARVTICRIQNPRLQHSEEKVVRLKHARLIHTSFESLDSTTEGQSLSKNEFQLITHSDETLEFRLESDPKCLEWVKVLTILTTYPNVYMPWETQNPVTFHSKPDPYMYGSDLVWAVFVMHAGIAKKGLVVGVNVVALRNTSRGGTSAPTLDLIYPQDPTNKIACWEKEKINAVGRMGKLVFLEISKECEPGGGLVWMYVGYGEEVGLYENVKKFLYQGDESFVHIKTQQPLTHDYARRPFHSDTPPSMDEYSDLPILDLQQLSLVEQVMKQWGHGAAANLTQESTPPSSPPATNFLAPQQHPTQPVTAYNPVPDYPQTVKSTHQHHFQPVASKLVPDHPPTTKSLGPQQHSTQPPAAKSVSDYPRTVKSQGTQQYHPQPSAPDHSPTTKSLPPQQHPTQSVAANSVPDYPRTVKSQGTQQYHSQLVASKSASYHPSTTNSMEPQRYPTQLVTVNAKSGPDHSRTVKSPMEQRHSQHVAQKSAPEHFRTVKSLETQHHGHAQTVAVTTTSDHPQAVKSLGPEQYHPQLLVASDHPRTVKFMELQQHHTQAEGAKSTQATKLSAMTSLGPQRYHTKPAAAKSTLDYPSTVESLGLGRYHTHEATTAKSPPDHDLPPSSPQTTKDTKTSEPQLKDLVLELRHIHGWFHLGVCLGFPRSILDDIHVSYGASLDAMGQCKIQLLSTWRDGSSGCTWSAVVTALHQTGRAGLAKTIADKYGATVLGTSQRLEDRFPQQFKEIVLTDQQASAIVSLRKKIEMEDKKLLETERCLKEHKEYNRALEDKLEKLREELHFSARYRGKQLSDLQLLQMKKRENEIDIQTLEEKFQNLTDHRRLVAPSDQNELHQTMERLREKTEESHEIRQQLSQSLPKQEYAYKAAKELKERLGDVTFQCENVAEKIKQLQAEREQLSAALKSHEEELDQILLGGTQHEQHMPEYHNVILYEDGRVELKLKEAEIERCIEELQKKEAHIRMLNNKLEDKFMKLSEMDECIQKLEQAKMSLDTLSDPYEYVYRGGYSSTTELHLAEQISNMAAVEWLQYKIQLLREEANKRELLFQLSSLTQTVDEMSSTLEAMAGASVPPAQPATHGQLLHQSFSAEELRGLPVLPNPVDLQNELPQSRNETSPPTSQSQYYQSHPPSVSTRHHPVTATTSMPTTERFTSEYENISSLSPGPHTMNPLMYRHERNRPENSSHLRYSMYGDHGVSSMPYGSSTQHEIPSYDPVQREKQATSV